MFGSDLSITGTTNLLKLENLINEYEFPPLYSHLDEQLLFGELCNHQYYREETEIYHQNDNKSCFNGVPSDVVNWNEFDYPPPPPSSSAAAAFPCNIYNTDQISSCLEFNDLNNIYQDFGLWEDHPIPIPIPIDAKPLNYQFGYDFDPYYEMPHNTGSMMLPLCETITHEQEVVRTNKVINKSSYYNKSSTLTLDDIQKYFDVPITKAAKELNVGLTVLKKRCRELNIARWPHRKIKSLTSLIDNVKELGLKSELAMLEEHKKMLMELPEMELTERTKKLRQACFKANYSKKRKLAHSPPPSIHPL